jgi:hypothetical protein
MSRDCFIQTTYVKTPLAVRHDANGRMWMSITAHATLTAKTPYKVVMGQYGWVTAAMADDTFSYYIGFPPGAIASGAVGEVQIGGYISGMITPSLSMTAGHAFEITDGAIADQGAAPTGALNEFGTAAVVSTTSTTQDAILFGRLVTGT